MPLKLLLVIAIFLLPLVPTFWAILDVPRRRFPSPKKKVVWFVTVSTLPFLGAVLYLLIARRHTSPMEIPQG
ncbi:MAG: PLDc N-terminal domain-containing protein [Syntrophobacteraceae bacterium]|nr:PLDc N-terminal domain-containing protein [Syntrophobacteraceae bacterium]